MKKLMCVALVLFATQSAIADYVLISGSRDNNSTKSIIRYRDTFDIIWERSEATGFADRSYNDIEVNPNDPNYGGGNLYTTQYEFDVGYLSARHFDAATGELLGQCVPSGYGEGQLDGTGTYNPTLVEGASLVLQDIVFGHDYNGDGVQDLWVCRRGLFEVYDGTTVNRLGDDGTADLLTYLYIPHSDEDAFEYDGTGGFGFCFGLDVTGDGIGELYVIRGQNNTVGSKLNVWNPVNLEKVTMYSVDGLKDNTYLVLGHDVNDDGAQDLWAVDPRNDRIVAIDCATGEIILSELPVVDASNPDTAVAMDFPQHISQGLDGTILISTRFATSLDPDYTGTGEIMGGNLLELVWDNENKRALATLLYEHTLRLSGAVYVPTDKTKSYYEYPLNNAEQVALDYTLNWSPGLSAVKHNVYLGTDINDVSQASVDDPRGVLVSPDQDEATYLPVELESNTTYYWRVDDVNDAHPDSPLMGKVWTFTTGDFVVIDDFEDYNDENNLVFDTWIDGIGNESNGSFTGNAGPPYMETNVVHGGSQSMPVTYGYQGAPMSEATRTLEAAVDASRFAQIRMWVIASRTSNTNQPMYITLNGTNKLTNDVNVTAATEWTEVAYDLGGVTSITSVTIGTGAGLGIVLVDDLRLHVAAPVE